MICIIYIYIIFEHLQYIDICLYVQEQVFCKKESRKHEKPTGWGSCFFFQNYPKLPFWGGRAWKGSVLSVWRLQQLKVGAGIAI